MESATDQVREWHAHAVAQRDTARRELEAWGKVVSGLEDLHPDLAQTPAGGTRARTTPLPPSDGRPRGQAAVLEILGSHHGEYLTVGDVLAEMTKRGWWPADQKRDNPVRNALDRLVSAGEVERGQVQDRVAYRAKPQASIDFQRRGWSARLGGG